MASTTADEVIKGIDLSDKTAIVTGGYSRNRVRDNARVREAGATVNMPARLK